MLNRLSFPQWFCLSFLVACRLLPLGKNPWFCQGQGLRWRGWGCTRDLWPPCTAHSPHVGRGLACSLLHTGSPEPHFTGVQVHLPFLRGSSSEDRVSDIDGNSGEFPKGRLCACRTAGCGGQTAVRSVQAVPEGSRQPSSQVRGRCGQKVRDRNTMEAARSRCSLR